MPLPYNQFERMPRPKPPDQIQAEIYADKIARNQVERLPQQNRAQDLAIQGTDQNITQTRKDNARKVAANYFSAIAQSPTPMQAAQQMLANPNWAAVSQELGLPQFTPEGETDDTIRAKSQDWARAMGGDSMHGQVQSTFVNPTTRTKWVVMRDGTSMDTGVSATQFADRVVSMGPGLGNQVFRPGSGEFTDQPVTPEQAQAGAQANQSSEKIGEWIGKQYGSIQEAGLSANQTLAKYDRLESLGQAIETGRLAGVKKSLGEVAQALGADIEGLDELQAFSTLANELALEMRNPAGGAGMPGAMSDADREFLLRTVPNLLNTPGGNLQIIKYARSVAKRNQEVALLARQYKAKSGKFDDAFLEDLASWSSANPMFPQSSQPAAQAEPQEGQEYVNDAGEVIVLRNNQWVRKP